MDDDDQNLCAFLFIFCMIVGLIIGGFAGLESGYHAGFDMGNSDLQKKWDVRHGMSPFEYHSIEIQKDAANKTYLSGYEVGYTDGFQAGFNKEDVTP